MMCRRIVPALLVLSLSACNSDDSDDVSAVLVEPAGADFEDVLIGQPTTIYVKVKNSGGSSVQLQSVALSQNSSGAFAITSAYGQIDLAPKAQVTVAVTYTPSGEGADSGMLQIATSDMEGDLINVTLSGKGVRNPKPEIDVKPSNLNFGTVQVGSSATRDLIVENKGSDVLDVTRISFASGSSGDFTLNPSDPSGSLAPGASLTCQVAYNPSVAQRVTSMLIVESNDSNESMQTVRLAGRGAMEPAPEIDVSTEALDFTEILIGTSRTLGVVVKNVGTSSLELGSYGLDEGAGPEFSIGSGPGPVSIAAGSQVTIEITYTPVDTVADSSTLQIRSNDMDEALVTVSLAGGGIEATRPQIEVSPTGLVFGDLLVGDQKSLDFTISNIGSAPLAVSRIALGLGSASEFAIVSGPSSVNLNPSASVTVTVRYTAADEGADSGTVRIESDDEQASLVVVSLYGAGKLASAPEIDVAPSSIGFGQVEVGQTKTDSFTIVNQGSGPLTLTSVRLTAATSTDFAITAGPNDGTSLQAGQSVLCEVTYAPGDEGSDTGALEIISDDADESRVTFAVSGSGMVTPPPVFSVSLAWDAPVLNEDGTPLVDLVGYRIYVGQTLGVYTRSEDAGIATQYTVDGLLAGTYFFVVTAYDNSGNESDYSVALVASVF